MPRAVWCQAAVSRVGDTYVKGILPFTCEGTHDDPLSQYCPQALAGALRSPVHQTNLVRNVGRDTLGAATCDTPSNPANANPACYWKSALRRQHTLITHTQTGKTRFLGYDIVAQRSNDKLTHSKRSINGEIELRVPEAAITRRCARYM
jgi:hypothetical protein